VRDNVIHDQRECGILVLDGAKVRALASLKPPEQPLPLRDRSRVLADATARRPVATLAAARGRE
jgi:hypothetical protein